MRPNPVPWAAAVLYEASAVIEQKLGAQFLPGGGQLYPAGPDEHGTGGFSAVFPCVDPSRVIKVTADGSEAFLSEVVRRVGPLQGLPDYDPEPIKISRAGEPMWIVWHQDLPGPNLYREMGYRRQKLDARYPSEHLWFSKDREAQKALQGRYVIAKDEFGVTDARDLDSAQQAGMSLSSLFVEVEKNGGDVQDAQRILRGKLPWAARVFSPSCGSEYDGWRFMVRGENDLDISERAALNLLGYEMLLGRLAIGKLVPELAQSLLLLLQQGVIVCDAQPDNVSAATRPYTLFDGGFTLPLDGRWNELWKMVGPKIQRWWNHDKRIRSFEVWLDLPERKRYV